MENNTEGIINPAKSGTVVDYTYGSDTATVVVVDADPSRARQKIEISRIRYELMLISTIRSINAYFT